MLHMAGFFFLILSQSYACFALDPFTIAAGAQAIGGILGATGGESGGWMEAAETGIALGELLTEVGVDPTAEDEAKQAVEKIEKIRGLVGEAKATKREVEGLLDLEALKASSHASRLKQIRRLVEVTKRIGILFGAKPKIAEKALQVQQTQLNQMMLEELMATRRARLDQFLREQSLVIERRAMLERIKEEENANRAEQINFFKDRGR